MLRQLMLGCVLALSSSYTLAEAVDLKHNMKQMKLEFKQAAQASDVQSMKSAIDNLQALVEQSKRGDYPPEKFDLYLEGFNKLSVTLDNIEAELEAGKLDKAQQQLREVDQLREEYHDKRNPSIWSKLFG
ncbi:cytochrome b562 [Vibrio sp. CAU 1672]|uniref:cytochrome b562 n=1 Tax=Vibrio sp. CAU 1672 TaxID=3032594 RepID=UPI0023DBCF98|nr:cytochrome b562 [Vibrio sp. CAU 1672]MDF2152633.1 cytochrome b562 [Vibrio sp. CAU 1672]